MLRLTEARSGARVCDPQHLRNVSKPDTHETIQDLNLDEQTQSVKRHNGTDAPPVKDRPRKRHIGFQELSGGGDHAQIRNARIKLLD